MPNQMFEEAKSVNARAIWLACQALGIEAPNREHPIYTVLPYLNDLDYHHLDNDTHPFWVANFAATLFGARNRIYTHPEQYNAVMEKIIRANMLSLGAMNLSVDWDKIITRRHYAHEVDPNYGISIESAFNSTHLSGIGIGELIKLQQMMSSILAMVGNPNSLEMGSDEDTTWYNGQMLWFNTVHLRNAFDCRGYGEVICDLSLVLMEIFGVGPDDYSVKVARPADPNVGSLAIDFTKVNAVYMLNLKNYFSVVINGYLSHL